jgi:uncharacterized protein (TIGR03000 family)
VFPVFPTGGAKSSGTASANIADKKGRLFASGAITMNLLKLLSGRMFLAGAAWVLVAGSLRAQLYGPAFPGPGTGSPPPGLTFGTITGNFGATGYGTASLGGMSHLSLGTSGGGGGYGSYNRYGRLSRWDRAEMDRILGPLPPEDNVAHLRIIVPTRDAELWVNDTLMKKQGTRRAFISPFLMPDKRFVYDLKVRYKDRDGRVVERSRSVRVQAGSQDVVDFTRPEDSAPTVSQLGWEIGLDTDR